MGLFDFMKVCLFSEVNGVVTLEGKPVAGAEIVRSAEINDKPYTDKTVTDENGRFHFDAMYTHSVNKILPMEPVIPQKILIKPQGHEYLAWEMTKHDYGINDEIKMPIRLACELLNKESGKEYGPTVVWGICSIT